MEKRNSYRHIFQAKMVAQPRPEKIAHMPMHTSVYAQYHRFKIGHKNIGEISPLLILLIVCMVIRHLYKHCHSESIN